MPSLYNLSQDYQKLLAKDEYDEADMMALDQVHGFIEDKVIHCAYVIKELEGKLAMTESAIKIATEKKKRFEANISKLKQYVLDAMVANNIEKIDKDPLFDVKVKQNPVSVDDYDPKLIPEEYWVHKDVVTLDKKKVKEDIENLGLVIPGAKLIRKIQLKID